MQTEYDGPRRTHFNQRDKNLNEYIDASGIPMRSLGTMYHEFFKRMDYDWWYEVQPGDVVVDLGACIGMFTLHALDKGAKKVYSVEGSKQNLETTIKNLSPYWLKHGHCPVVPIHTMIGDKKRYSLKLHNYVYSDEVNLSMMSFKEFLEKYKIEHIDYLKVDIEGSEYDIFTEENIFFLRNHVKHMSVEFHLNCFREAPWEWMRVRELIGTHFDLNKVRYMSREDEYEFHGNYDTEFKTGQWPHNNIFSGFMLYITNW